MANLFAKFIQEWFCGILLQKVVVCPLLALSSNLIFEFDLHLSILKKYLSILKKGLSILNNLGFASKFEHAQNVLSIVNI